MALVRRWWQKHGLPLIFTVSSVSLAWLIYQSRGAAMLELFYVFTRYLHPHPQIDRQALNRDRTVQELDIRLTELETQNEQLKQLLGYVKAQKEAVIPAPIIGRSPDAWWQLVTIGVGSKRGVKEDDAVTAIGGLVGRVVEVTPHTSRVLLISDSSRGVGATISRTRYMGVIRGKSSQTAVMEFYAKVSDVKVGDVVTTSAISSIFPPKIPIGKVVSVNLNKSPAPEATIEFTAPIDFLEWVVVHIK
jgi:rod shape-determining protein MreC